MSRLDERIEYWWVARDATAQPAEIRFRGGIPFTVRLIGSSEIVPATAVDLMDRLPLAPTPAPTLRASVPTQSRAPDRSIKVAWLVGLIVITLLMWFSDRLFDAIR
jgi:hypothetical protein